MTEFGLVQGLVLENEPGFEVRPFRFEAVQSSLYLGSLHHYTIAYLTLLLVLISVISLYSSRFEASIDFMYIFWYISYGPDHFNGQSLLIPD